MSGPIDPVTLATFSTSAGGDVFRPSVLELSAQEHMRGLLAPALRFVLAAGAQRFPRTLLPVHRYASAVHAVLMVAVENHFLVEWGGSFTENFYGLGRASVDDESQKSGRARKPLTPKQIRTSMLTLVLLPFVKSTLDEAYEAARRRQFIGGIVPTISASGSRTTDRRSSANKNSSQNKTVLDRLRIVLAKIKKSVFYAFMVGYPIAGAAYSLVALAFQIAYMSGVTSYYDPLLWFCGTKLVRLGVEDYRQNASVVASARESAQRDLAHARGIQFVAAMLKIVMQEMGRVVRAAAPYGLFMVQFMEWFSGTEYFKSVDRKPIPAPPEPIPPHPDGVVVPEDKRLCPLCKKLRTNPAALPSGYAFCYACVHGYVREHDRCPVSFAAAQIDEIRVIYTEIS